MSIDLEARLERYGHTLDQAIEQDLVGDVQLVQPLTPRSIRRPGRFVAIAAAGLLVGASLAMLADHLYSGSSDSLPANVNPASTTTTTTTSSPNESLWDAIRIAPGTTGWFEFGPLPQPLTAIVPVWQSWSPEYAAQFYDCVSYTMDTDGPVCDGLRGGNYVASVTFGGTGELGTHLGDVTTADLAWTLAQGSLWGYDEMPSRPPATPVEVGPHQGVKYSNNNTTYLVWEQAPGIHLWLRATGFSDADLVALAATVTPAVLPSRLPLPILLDASDTSGAPRTDTLLYGWQHGEACVAFYLSGTCTTLQGDGVLVAGTNGVGASPSVIASVSPAGSSAHLEVVLAEGSPVSVQPVESAIGRRISVFRSGTKQVVAANLKGPDGSTIAQEEFPSKPSSGSLPATTVGTIAPTSTAGLAPSSVPSGR